MRDGLATRVVILSAFDDDELVYSALEAGAAGYLTKDATQEEIARRRSTPSRAATP